MVVMVVVFRGRNDAPVNRNGALHMFELHRGVVDVKLVEQGLIDFQQHTFAGRRGNIVDQHVAA